MCEQGLHDACDDLSFTLQSSWWRLCPYKDLLSASIIWFGWILIEGFQTMLFECCLVSLVFNWCHALLPKSWHLNLSEGKADICVCVYWIIGTSVDTWSFSSIYIYCIHIRIYACMYVNMYIYLHIFTFGRINFNQFW